MARLIAQRNAVSVLPLPVGARISVESPRAIAGQPCTCGGVGAAKLARNHSPTAGWNRSNTSPRLATFTILFRKSPSVFGAPTPVFFLDGRFGRRPGRRRSADPGADGRTRSGPAPLGHSGAGDRSGES